MQIFKYLEAVPRMGSILKTLSTAFVDLSLFIVLVVVLYFGFASAFYVCFGAEMYNWRSLGDSIGALSRAVLGDFDYAGLVATNATMARVLFYSFVLVVVFVVLSMFLALINDAYAEVKATEPPQQEIFAQLTNRLFSQAKQVCDSAAAAAAPPPAPPHAPLLSPLLLPLLLLLLVRYLHHQLAMAVNRPAVPSG